jgi:hypothetical protein
MQNVPQIVRERLKIATPAVNHPDADALTAFAEHSLPGIERDIVLEHLARCGDCREVVALALPATEPVQTVFSPSSSPSSGWLTWPALRWAFVAAGVIAIASFGILQYRKSTHPTTMADRSTAPQATTEAKNQLPPVPVAPPPAEKRNEIQAPPALGDSVSGANLTVMQNAGPAADSGSNSPRSNSKRSNSKKTAAPAAAVGRTGPTGSFGSTLGDQKSFGPKANQFQQQNIAQNQAPAPAPPVAFGKKQASARSSAGVTGDVSGAVPQVAPAQSLNQNLDSTLAQNQPAIQPPSSEAYAFEKMSRAKLPVPPGQIGGYVVDPSGAAVANARITLIPSKTGQNATTAVTNSQGLWLIAGVPTGSYKAQAEAPGFRTTVASVNYDANQPSMYSFTLNVGSVAETVEVAAQNGQVQNGQVQTGQVPTETTAIVTDGGASQLPLNGRGFSELATLSPGPLWTISSSGALRRSVDQGKTWQDVNVNANPGALTSASVAVAAQVSGAKARQTDKALKRQPATPTFRTVAAAGAEIWAGGSEGALYHSADAGSHWTRVVPAAAGTILTGDIISLEFPDLQHGKLSTTTADVWITTDGGQTWSKE